MFASQQEIFLFFYGSDVVAASVQQLQKGRFLAGVLNALAFLGVMSLETREQRSMSLRFSEGRGIYVILSQVTKGGNFQSSFDWGISIVHKVVLTWMFFNGFQGDIWHLTELVEHSRELFEIFLFYIEYGGNL